MITTISYIKIALKHIRMLLESHNTKFYRGRYKNSHHCFILFSKGRKCLILKMPQFIPHHTLLYVKYQKRYCIEVICNKIFFLNQSLLKTACCHFKWLVATGNACLPPKIYFFQNLPYSLSVNI